MNLYNVDIYRICNQILQLNPSLSIENLVHCDQILPEAVNTAMMFNYFVVLFFPFLYTKNCPKDYIESPVFRK